MIIHLKKNIEKNIIESLSEKYNAFVIKKDGIDVLITSSSLKTIEDQDSKYVDEKFVFSSDIQLASREYQKQTIEVKIGDQTIGGDTNNCIMVIGPCAVESEEQIEQAAQFLSKLNLKNLRAGCYKPRTSPYSFQGLGLDGLKILKGARDKYNYSIFSEVRDSTHIENVIEYADVIQIGAKSMYDHGILKRCGESDKPILLKRGFGTTIQEFVQAAEFILSKGNPNVILCERGIRTFENKTRFTLDLCGVAYIKEHINLPVILDPSHAMGYAYGVPDLAKACMAMGVDGMLIEVHPNPKVAKSDAQQQLDFDTFEKLYKQLVPIAKAVGRKIV